MRGPRPGQAGAGEAAGAAGRRGKRPWHHTREGEASFPEAGHASTLAAPAPRAVYWYHDLTGNHRPRDRKMLWRVGGGVRIVLTWLRLEARRRWVSLVVLALLVAVSTATVLTAAAGARRGDTALDRLEAQTLPATVAVLANQPGFNWNKIKALPEVAAMTRFPVTFSFVVDDCPGASTDFPMMDASYGTTIERPEIIAGRRADPSRADEVVVTPQFLATCHHRLGDTLTLDLAAPKQIDQGYDGSQGAPAGPHVRVRIVGVGNTVWDSVSGNGPGQHGAVIASPGLYAHYPANMAGHSPQVYI